MTFFERIAQFDLAQSLGKKLPSIKQMVLGGIGIVLFGYLFLILLSYNPADPAWSHVSSDATVTNIGGTVGAWLSDILRTFFGWGAWLIVLFLAYELLRVIGFRTQVAWLFRLLAYGSLLGSVSALLSYGAGLKNPDLSTVVGGVFGHELQSAIAGLFGAGFSALFFIAFILVVSALTFEIRWQSVSSAFIAWLMPNKSKSDDMSSADEMDDKSVQVLVDDDVDIVDDGVADTDEVAYDYVPHNHHGAFESFVKHSGVQQDLSKIHEQEQAAEQTAKEVSAAERFNRIARQAISRSAIKPDMQSPQATSDAPTVQDEVLIEQVSADWQSPHSAAFTQDTPTADTGDDVDADDADNNLWQDDTPSADDNWQTVHSDWQADADMPMDDGFDDDDDAMWDDAPAPQTASKSRAMDTLSYRMSLTPLPELDLLDKPNYDQKPVVTEAQLAEASELLEIKLQEFNIKANVISAMVGPVVTRFEVDLAPGVKASRVSRVAQDLARSMSKASLRVVEVIPGKPYIGIEVPNKEREMVRLIELLDTPDFRDPDKQIAIAVGKDIGGKPVIADLAKAPHMLVAGTTGSGKSVLVNSFLLSMLLKYTPDELKLVLIDPKQLELANYGDIPHLLTPVITDMKDAVAALTWCVNEMERRYQLMSKLRVRKISEFNKKVEHAESIGEPIYDPLWQMNDSVSQSKPPKLKPLPTIVIVADEFADMIMQLGKTAEEPIVRLAQKARAAGIHLLLATQRPTVNVVTGLIKANVPARVALRVNSKVDSRTIIEEGGAEDMLGHGDMMFIGPGKNNPERMHGAFVDDDEVNRVCDAWRERGSPDYIDLSDSYTFEGEGSGDMGSGGASADELYEAAAAFVVETRKPSISAVQRKFSIGYNRAARLLDQMEERGLVTAMDHSGKRQLLL
ncbi:DNA translocase FtsK [uncultured Moraxella sp.]|uniref:DNA translocase FtsK n=1 Tax=uncultured Moraxella sp. TaxID=263769 RepID=UPI0025FD7A7C|nr:DNA translocase FtsK [uncultured Moraxella sp.]